VGSFNRKVLVVEDDALLRSLIVSKLEADGFVVQATDSAATARKIADDFDPDVALLDIELGNGPTGIDLALILRKSQPEIALVFLTHIPEPRVVGIDNRKIPKNAAYLAKDRITDPTMLSDAIDAALRGKAGRDFRDDKRDYPLAELSRSQLAVLQMVALGMSNSEIAKERDTTVRAVENLVKRAFEAAGIDTEAGGNPRVNAAREYIRIAGLPHGK
jgi:DNA-binding NarL/FixJ family response regulator